MADDPKNPMPLLPKPKPFGRPAIVDLVIRRGFPEFRLLSDRERADRCTSYVDSIIERDISAVHPVRKPDAVRRLIFWAESRTGQEINVQALAQDMGVKHITVTDCLDALTRLGTVLRLGAWSSAKAKREMKAPKRHFMDTGLAAALRGEDADSFGIAADPEVFGALFGTSVITELEKSLPFLSKRWSLWHWRAGGREIDILAQAPGRLMAQFEMKATSKIGNGDFRHINWFFSEGPERITPERASWSTSLANCCHSAQAALPSPASMLWAFSKRRANCPSVGRSNRQAAQST